MHMAHILRFTVETRYLYHGKVKPVGLALGGEFQLFACPLIYTWLMKPSGLVDQAWPPAGVLTSCIMYDYCDLSEPCAHVLHRHCRTLEPLARETRHCRTYVLLKVGPSIVWPCAKGWRSFWGPRPVSIVAHCARRSFAFDSSSPEVQRGQTEDEGE